MLSRGRRLLQDLDISPRNAAVAAALAVALALGTVAVTRPGAKSGDPASVPGAAVAHAPPVAAINAPPARRKFPARGAVAASRSGEGGSRPGAEGQGGWWFGTAGVALALAVVGWGSVAARRYAAPRGAAGPVAMRVVGRTSLSPKLTVYLLDVGGRVLILGAGPQGAPTLLGELTDGARDSDCDHRPGGES